MKVKDLISRLNQVDPELQIIFGIDKHKPGFLFTAGGKIILNTIQDRETNEKTMAIVIDQENSILFDEKDMIRNDDL